MKEKLLIVLVVASLILSVFNLVLMLRTNGTNTITDIVGQSSNVTWKKVELNYTLISDYAYPDYSLTIGNDKPVYEYPLWNITITLQWINGTVQYFNVEPYLVGGGTSYISIVVELPLGLLYGSSNMPRSSWNVTSITAYIIQTPQ